MVSAVCLVDSDFPYGRSSAQIAFYSANGYIKLKQVLSPEALAYYRQEISQGVQELNTLPGGFGSNRDGLGSAAAAAAAAGQARCSVGQWQRGGCNRPIVLKPEIGEGATDRYTFCASSGGAVADQLAYAGSV